MEELLKQLLTEVREIKASQARAEQRLEGVEAESRATREGLARMENDMGTKIAALFDGYTLRGEQIERLQEHLDERLDSIQTDLSYVVGKVAQHDRNFVRLRKKA